MVLGSGNSTPLRALSLIAAALLLAGCALNRAGSQEVSAALERQAQQACSVARAYADGRASASAPTPATQPGPGAEPLTRLRDYLLLALQQNPDILAAQETAHAAAAKVPQVTALPDPMLETRTLPTPYMLADGSQFFILGVSQQLPLPEKLDLAGRMALEETRMALAELERARQRVIAEVKRTYFQLYVIDRTTEITLENKEVLRGLIEVARNQVAAGKRSQEDLLRAQLELLNLESELIELRQRRTTAAAMLNALLNRSPATPIPRLVDFDLRRVEAAVTELFARAGEVNPELKRFERQIERDRQAVRLAQLAYWPDINLGFEWMLMEPRAAFRPPRDPETGMRPAADRMSEEGSDMWAINFSFNVPIWLEKIEAGIREARRRLAASTHAYVAARNTIYFQIADALARVRAQQELADLFATSVIPQARQAYEVSRASYMVGAADFQFLVENWQKWLRFRIQYHRAVGEVERSVADLEQAVGSSIVEARQLGGS